MLRKRSIAPSSSKQGGLMQDHMSIPSPTSRTNRPTSLFFQSPLSLTSFSAKPLPDSEAVVMSPTSILENKPFASIGKSFFADKTKQTSNILESGDSSPIGLGLIDALREEDTVCQSPKGRRMVLFGSQLKIQIPSVVQRPISPSELVGSPPRSPVEFGIKTMNSHVCSFSPSCLASEGVIASPRIFTGALTASEMELSEDYTRVITHGPNPKTTHIFDNCVVESCGDSPDFPADVFIRFCCTCGKDLALGNDIFIYRGEKAFCSRQCRCKEMSDNKEMEKQPQDVL